MLLVAICPVQSLFERMRIRAMSEQDYSWVDDLIGSMEDEFNPSTKVNADQLEDGSYVFKVENMELEKIESTGTPIVRWTLKVLEGPSCVDSIVERTSYFGKPVALNILGSDLTLLGSLPRDWKKDNIPLAKLLVGAVGKTIGKVFNGRKRTNSNQQTGKTYHNISVVSLKKSEESDEAPF
jgi:hypothetical protein